MKIDFFGPPESPLLGVFHEPRQSGVPSLLLCASLGHEYLRGHRALRMVAERWPGAAFRFDWTGSGDSAGEAPPSVERLVGDVEAAAVKLRGLAPEPIVLVGLRIGALVAEKARASLSAKCVGWHPPLSGDTWIREIQAIDAEARRLSHVERPAPHAEDLLGFAYPPLLLEGLRELRRLPETNVTDPSVEDWGHFGHREVPWLPGPSFELLLRSLRI